MLETSAYCADHGANDDENVMNRWLSKAYAAAESQPRKLSGIRDRFDPLRKISADLEWIVGKTDPLAARVLALIEAEEFKFNLPPTVLAPTVLATNVVQSRYKTK